eukprot:6722-Heterococcus_DN1.PRE.2
MHYCCSTASAVAAATAGAGGGYKQCVAEREQCARSSSSVRACMLCSASSASSGSTSSSNSSSSSGSMGDKGACVLVSAAVGKIAAHRRNTQRAREGVLQTHTHTHTHTHTDTQITTETHTLPHALLYASKPQWGAREHVSLLVAVAVAAHRVASLQQV